MTGIRRTTAWASCSLALAVGASAAAAQAAPLAPIVAQSMNERGLSVEVLGLQRWTTAMLRDSMAKQAPGLFIAHRKFPAVAKNALGFRDVLVAQVPGDSALNLLVAFVEPGDSTQGRPRALASDTSGSRAPWPDLVEIARKRSYAFQGTFQLAYARSVGLPPAVPIRLRADSSEIRSLWAILEAHRTPHDAAQARQLLLSSPNVYDRVAAVAILANLERDDASWHALAGALLDPEDRVRLFASLALRTLAADAPRTVDWTGAEADLRAIVNGAVLDAIPTALTVLVATRLDPALGARLLRDGALGVRIFAGATSAPVRQPIYRFLRVVGRAPGGLPEAWRSIASGGRS